ncbi:type II toxin-antitoxin system HicA family toxin [Thiocapsa sp.]|uniref:type II toxin-antitoxin system HicA family toxin n=1 Tax=Thiocapsa sp. TaxID=2024551 RepID=UPI0025F5547A|nr:type II toxin-antitoxin system HicA family toxin [Thiocapsa sp.]
MQHGRCVGAVRCRCRPSIRQRQRKGSGSAVTFEKDGRKANFHRPHPRKEALKYRVKQVREYLTQLGITP